MDGSTHPLPRSQPIEVIPANHPGLDPRQRGIAREAAVLGYVLGNIRGGHHTDTFPKDSVIVADVLRGAMSNDDLYPELARLSSYAGEQSEEGS